jgi:hypothetical protein
MNHERPKNARAVCLLCKQNKMNGAVNSLELGHAGFGKLRSEAAARADLTDNQFEVSV